MKRFLLLLAAVASPATSPAQNVANWRTDLAIIAKELPARHPNAFFRMSRATWDSAVASVDAKLPSMTRNQAFVSLMQLVALVRDGHTSINPLFDRGIEIHYFPVSFDQFDDGVYVKSAPQRFASLVGAKVVRIGKVPVADALASVATTISYENEWFLKSWATSRLNLSEVMDGLGLLEDPARLPLVLERNGRQETVTLAIAGTLAPTGHSVAPGIDMTGWTDMRTSATAPLWQRNQDKAYWWEFNRLDSTLYVSYRGVIDTGNPTNQQFWRGVFAAADSLPVNRMVLDIRQNLGGNSFYNKQVIRGIVARPRLDRRDKLFVITSGRTFSAAMNLSLDLENWTNATFVGEPTGAATANFGDHEPLILPVSRLTLNVSTLPWYPDDPRDKRDFIAPRIYVPVTAAQYRAGVDPVMEAIVAAGREVSLAARLEAAVTADDTVRALEMIREETAKPANRFRTPEADINTLGYRLMHSNSSAALAVFRLNTRAFPESANTWDSLGEALVASGDRVAGIAAYRKALELSPGLSSAVSALARLQ